MPATRKRDTAQDKAARGNLSARSGPLQPRSQRRWQLLDGNEDENACRDAEIERQEAEAEDRRNRERVRLEKVEARRIRLDELAAEEAALEEEVAVERCDEYDRKVAFFFMYLGGGDDLLYTKTSYYI